MMFQNIMSMTTRIYPILLMNRSFSTRAFIRLDYHPNVYYHERHRPSMIHTTRTSISTDSSLFLVSSSHENESFILSKYLRKAYEQNDTDGILDMAPTLFSSPLAYSSKEYLIATLNASSQNKAQIAGTLNALLAACHMYHSSQHDYEQQAKGRAFAWDLFTAWQEWKIPGNDDKVTMDIMSYCITYECLDTTIDIENDDYDLKAEKLLSIHRSRQVLELARRWSCRQGTTTGMKKKRRDNNSSRSARTGSQLQLIHDDQKQYVKDRVCRDFNILQETKDFLVINKPSGMVCYHKHRTNEGKVRKGNKKASMPSFRGDLMEEDSILDSKDVSLEDAISSLNIPLSELNPDALGIVHRLDRGTSGCIILAKNDMTHAKLVTAFFSRNAKKSYLAIVSYHVQEACLQKRQIHEKDLAVGFRGSIDIKVQGKPALSEYTVLKIIPEHVILLRVVTYTGRYHQVRQHCAQGLGRPILFDPEYGFISEPLLKLMEGNTHGHSRFCLHCETLSIDSLQIHADAPVPSWWNTLLKKP